MITLLTFDTATHACSVALQHHGKIFSRFDIAPQQHAQLLLPMIQAVLSEAKIKLTDLHAIAYGCGPGSFMGVRLSLGMAQGLAFGLNIPVIAISTLQTLAQTAYQKSQHRNIIAGWDAILSSIYWGVYAMDQNNIMQKKQVDHLNSPHEISQKIDMMVKPDITWLYAGNAWEVYKHDFPSSFFDKTEMLTTVYPEAESMCIIGISKY